MYYVPEENGFHMLILKYTKLKPLYQGKSALIPSVCQKTIQITYPAKLA